MLKYIILLIFLSVVLSPVSSQTHISDDFREYTLEIFPIANIKKLDIRAKHAQINLLNWEKDSISVETSIEILSDKPNLSKEMLEEVTIRKASYANTLLVKTNFIEEFNRTIPYKITYNIFYPKKLAVRIENSHGLVNIGNVEGGVFADISYCDISFNDFSQVVDSLPNNINLTHCTGKINHLGSSTLKIENSSIEVLDATNINASTAYSFLSFEKVYDYVGNSRVDNIKFNLTDNISLTSDNSIIELGNFNAKAHFECKKGSLKILNSNVDFRELTLNNTATETQVHLNENSSYSINGEIINGVFSHTQTNKIQIIKDLDNTSVSGEVGNIPSSTTKVIIFNRNQNIVFN